MKEFEARLTKNTRPSTLRSEGISMPEEGKEAPQPQESHTPTPGSEKIVPPEKIEAARKAWGDLYKGKTLKPGEGAVIEDLIRRGAMPITGGSGEVEEEAEESVKNPSVEDIRRNEALKRILDFQEILKKSEVVAELRKKNPDFKDESLAELGEFIDGLDISEAEFPYIAVHTARLNTDIHGNAEDPNRISEESRRLIYESLYEKIIGRPDKGSEEAPYSVGSLQLQNVLEQLDTSAMSEFSENLSGEEKNFATYLSELKHVRQVMHDLRRNLENGEQYKEYVLGHLRTAGLNFVQNEMAGAGAVQRLYEKVTSNRVAQRKEWFNQGDLEAIKDEVKTVFEKSNPEKDGRPLTDWEMARALRIGGIMFAGTQRMAMYSALGDIPSWAVSTDRVASLPYEYIGRAIVPFKMTASRFWAYDKGGPRKFMEMILKEQEKKDKGKYINLFGLDNRTMMLNSYGALDPESHGWRSQLMFLGPIRLELGEHKMSLLELLNNTARRHDAVRGDPILGGGDVSDKKAFSRDVSDVILGQRLYLSILQRYGNFDTELKTKIWEKIALLKPSTIASLAPEVLTGKEKAWENLRMKLYAAEEKRVARDGELYKKDLTEPDLLKEKNAFLDTLRVAKGASWTSAEFKAVLKYAGLEGLELNPEESELLGTIMREGLKKATGLAGAKMPFAFAVDDAPNIAWAKTGDGITGLADEDLFRILLSDQKHLAEGWGEINSLVESPTHGAIEHMAKAVEAIGTVHGRGPAQETIEPFIIAYLKFAETKEEILFTPGAKTVSRFRREATSELEKYYRNTFLSMDEKDKHQFLMSLSQAKAIADNVVNVKDGLTQLDRIMKETKSDRAWLLIHFLRNIIFLFGPVAGYELAKTIFPPLK